MLQRCQILLLLIMTAAAGAQTPEESLRQAQQLEKDGALQRAVAAYKEFIAKYPDHTQVTEANYRLAKCYDEQGLIDETIAQLKTVLASDKKSFRNRPDAFYMLGKLYASNKNYKDATAIFEKMLSEGAALYEDEVLNLLGGYYAIQQRYDEAAGKFNILKRRKDSPFAEQAAYKLAALWLKAEKIELAIESIQDLASSFPQNKQIPELLLRAADVYRVKKDFDKTISICEQLKSRYPKAVETIAGNYLLGLCYRDKKDFQKSADVLDLVARTGEIAARGIAAEAGLAAAEIYYADLNKLDEAVRRWGDAAKMASQSDSERKKEILEQCYFRLGEHYFRKKEYSIALENYLLLRSLGTNINILGRILDCQAALKKTDPAEDINAQDAETIKKRIAANPGTAIALEGEIFLLDRKLSEILRTRGVTVGLAEEYAKLLKNYPKEVLSQESLEYYVWAQIGTCYSYAATIEEQKKAIAAFEKISSVDNPYRITALENIALVAERCGDKPRAMKAYDELFALTKTKLDAAKDDKTLETKALGYLRSLVTRSDSDDMITKSIALCNKIIEEKGALSELAKDARINIAELYYLKKDYSNAAKTYREYIKIYGPKQDANGDVVGAPWKADGNAEPLYDAAIRIAHCWYMQHNDEELKRAYEWIVKNFPTNNKYMAEAQYYLAMELGKGKAGQTNENKRKLADSLWQNVVNPSMDFDTPTFKKSFHPWARVADDDPSNAAAYVKMAILRAGQTYAGINEHELAARMFEQYLQTYGGGATGGHKGSGPRRVIDENLDTARYALGREYAALERVNRMIETFKPYLNGYRDSRFRVSALKMMGYHATKQKMWDAALEAYATLIDEYGENDKNDKGQVIPVPPHNRLRQGSGWDGIRMPIPKDLNQGEIRYAVGYLFWRQEDFRKCALVLQPFMDDPALEKNAHRNDALFMAGQSCYKTLVPGKGGEPARHDYATGAKLFHRIIHEYPKFQGIEEVYELAVKGYANTAQWGEIELLHKKFVAEWPNSGRRPRMDLYSALASLNTGKTAKAMTELKLLIDGESDQATKADAHYYTGVQLAKDKKDSEAMQRFEKSVSLYPREPACLAGAKCAMRMKDYKRARELLERTTRDFPSGDPAVISEAKELLPTVLKELAKTSK